MAEDKIHKGRIMAPGKQRHQQHSPSAAKETVNQAGNPSSNGWMQDAFSHKKPLPAYFGKEGAFLSLNTGMLNQ